MGGVGECVSLEGGAVFGGSAPPFLWGMDRAKRVSSTYSVSILIGNRHAERHYPGGMGMVRMGLVTGKAAILGDRAKCRQGFRRGSDGGTHGIESGRNKGSLSE